MQPPKKQILGFAERSLAGFAFLAAISAVIGAKSAAGALPLLSLVTLATSGKFKVLRRRDTYLQMPFLLWVSFALVAIFSAVWSVVPVHSFFAGSNLLLVLLAAQVLQLAWSSMAGNLATLVGGWFCIGYFIGVMFLLADGLSNRAVTAVIITGLGSWVELDSSMYLHNLSIDPNSANWSIAGANLLLWPILRLIGLLAKPRWRLKLIAGFVLSVAAITFLSWHESSKIALIVGGVAFVLVRFRNQIMISILPLGFAAVALLFIPFSHFAHDTLRLHQASWVPYSLQERFVIWDMTANRYRDAPVLGVGANATKFLDRYSELPNLSRDRSQQWVPSSHAHNFILQVWFELGLLGSVFFTLAGAATLRTLRRLNAEAQGFAAASAAVTITICVATWSVWHLWVASIIGIGMALIAVGNSIANLPPEERVPFGAVWVPR